MTLLAHGRRRNGKFSVYTLQTKPIIPTLRRQSRIPMQHLQKLAAMSILFVLLFACLLHSCVCGSPYDDIVFPRPLEPPGQDESHPLGHNQPFGMQRAPDGPVIEYDKPLHPEVFWEEHIKYRVPLVYRNAISKSPAVKLWTDEYLNTTYGHLDVLVELKKENRTFSTGRMRLSEFIANYQKEQIYVVSLLPSPMMKDIQAIPSVLCGTFKKFTHESNFWYSSGGTRSVIHYDADQNLHCIIQGRKDVMMIKRKYEKYLYMVNREATSGSGFSTVDPDNIDMLKNPTVKHARWTYASLGSGDCIYIPGGYLHQVRAYGRTISATTLFTEQVNHTFSNTGCDSFDMDKYYTMSDIDFHWTYDIGDPTIDMGYMNIERLRSFLRDTVIEKGGKRSQLNLKKFTRFYNRFAYGGAQMSAKDVWDNVLNVTDNHFDVEDLELLTKEQLKQMARALDPPHGPKTDGYQSVSLRPGDPKEGDDDDEDDDEEREDHSEEEMERRDRERERRNNDKKHTEL